MHCNVQVNLSFCFLAEMNLQCWKNSKLLPTMKLCQWQSYTLIQMYMFFGNVLNSCYKLPTNQSIFIIYNSGNWHRWSKVALHQSWGISRICHAPGLLQHQSLFWKWEELIEQGLLFINYVHMDSRSYVLSSAGSECGSICLNVSWYLSMH